jgi:homoserine kinase type II
MGYRGIRMSAVPKNTYDHALDPYVRAYDLGEIQRVWPASHGIENQNYFIEASKDEHLSTFVLTIMREASFAGDSYVPMMRYLDGLGLPVASPLSNVSGEAITKVDDQYCLLQQKLSGQHPVNPTLKQIQALARFTGRMHQASVGWNVSLADYPRDSAWLNTQADTVREHFAYSDRAFLDDNLRQTKSMLGRSDTKNLPRGLIHGDLFRDNVLFNERGITGVLDFHHAATGFFIYDLAVTANDWCNDASGYLDPDRTIALLRSYNQIRPLTDVEVWLFPTFSAYAALVFWLSRAVAVVRSQTDDSLRTKDPEEFKRILRHVHKNPFYFDIRQLRG